MDLITHIPGVGPTAPFTPGPNTPAPYNVPHQGMTDGTNATNASRNQAEFYNRWQLIETATILEAGLSPDRANWTQMVQAIRTLASSAPLGGIVIPNFDIDNNTLPGAGQSRHLFANTQPAGWNNGPGRMTFTCDVQFASYFALNPSGHIGIVLRQDPTTITSSVRGNGCLFGNVAGLVEGTKLVPGAQIETWANGIMPASDRWVFPGAQSPSRIKDGVVYQLSVESSLGYDLRRRVRMVIYEKAANNGLDLIVDTGDVQDHNYYSDYTQSALYLGHVFGANVPGWSIRFRNVRVTWGPPMASATQPIIRVPHDFLFEVEKTGTTNFGGFAGNGVSAVAVWDNVTHACSFGALNSARTVFTFSRAVIATVSGAMPVAVSSASSGAGCSSHYRVNGAKQASGSSGNGSPGDIVVGGMPLTMTRRFNAGDTVDVLVEYSSSGTPAFALYGSNATTGAVKMTILVHS